MEKQPWLEIAEYTAIVGSVVGTVAAVQLQQLAYASAPLAVVLSLNFINRQRLQQQIQHYTSSDADAGQVVKPLFQQVGVPVQNVNLNVNLGSISELLSLTDQLMSNASNNQELLPSWHQVPPQELIRELQKLTAEIHQGFERIASCLEQENINTLKLEVSNLKSFLQSVDFNYIQGSIEQLKTQVSYLNEQHQSLTATFEVIVLSEKLASLEQKNTKFFKDYTNRMIPRIKHLQSEQASSQQEIKDIKEQLNNLDKKLENLSCSPEDNLSNMVKSLAPIQAHITSIGSIPEQIAQLKYDLQDLQEQVQHELRYAHRYYGVDPKK